MQRLVYLDWNATTPPHPDVLEAMRRAAETAWANPASVHRAGRAAKAFVEQARESVAELLGCCARDVLFTSGGTEANNLALVRPFGGRTRSARSGLLVTSRLEHPSVVAVAEQLEAEGVLVRWLEVGPSGRVEPAAVADALAAAPAELGPALVAVQAANHETGVLQPIEAIADVVHGKGAELHVDAVQAAGKVDPSAWAAADTVSLAAHKLRGPKGIGALGLRAGLAPVPILRGGAQERGLRPGTVDPVAAAGFGTAAERSRGGPVRYAAIARLRDAAEAALAAVGARTGHPMHRHGLAARLPHVINARFDGWAGDELVAALDLEGICIASGSACAAGTPEPSPVIRAMCGIEAARGAIRVSMGEATAEGDLKDAILAFERVLGRQVSSG